VLLGERLERAEVAAVRVFRPWRIEARGALAVCVLEHLVARHIHDLGVRVDELADEPWAGNSIGLPVLAGDPLHGVAPPSTCRCDGRAQHPGYRTPSRQWGSRQRRG